MSKLFRNSSPDALTRAQAEARERKSAAANRRQIRQARDLAAQGRGSDTEVAQVARGEIVLPRGLQTPTVLDALRRAAAAANIPLNRLRVGSASNSINPKTGMAEFDAARAAGSPIEEIVVLGNLITDDPWTNKEIAGLHPSMRYDAAKFINDVKERTGQQLRIPNPSGTRTIKEQDDIYAQGRTAPGTTPKDIVTEARGGESYHNYGLAFDIVGLNPDGKTPNYKIDFERFAPIAKEHGFDWGGNWKKSRTSHISNAVMGTLWTNCGK